MQTVHLADFPIKTAHFSSNGQEFICASRKAKHLYVYDLVKAKAAKVEVQRMNADNQGCLQYFEVSQDYLAFLGRFGEVHLLSAKSKEKVFSVKMNDKANCAAFAKDGRELYTHGGNQYAK